MQGLLSAAFRVGRFSGINIHVHITFVIWIAFQLIDSGVGWRTQALFTGMLFGIVLLHEFGHCFGARAVGGDAEDILMWPLGGLAFAHAPMTPWAQFVTVACGPLVNVAFCLISGAILIAAAGTFQAISINPFSPFGGYRFLTAEWQIYLHIFYDVNFMLLVFNLLPFFPMDGGQLFRVAIWPFLGLHRATIIAAQVGIAGAVGLALYGLGVIGSGSQNYMLVFLAASGAYVSYQQLMAAKSGLQQEHFLSYRSAGRYERGRASWWSRIAGKKRPPREAVADENPNPGGWERKQKEAARIEAEVDRILAKVKEHGMNSLSYVERQTLERATRMRRDEERELDRSNRH